MKPSKKQHEQLLIGNICRTLGLFSRLLLLHLHKVWPMDPWIPISKWDFLLISYLASSNFKELSNLQILIFQSRGGCVIKLKICYCVTCLKLKIHTSEKSEIFFRKKKFNLQILITKCKVLSKLNCVWIINCSWLPL